MEALRNQLAETQGALTEKIHQVRQLRVDHAAAVNAWTQQKQGFEAQLQQLEAEVRRLRKAYEPGGENEKPSSPQGRGNKFSLISYLEDGATSNTPDAQGGDNDKVVITRSRMQYAESKFKNITNELAQKTELCESLQRKVQHGSNAGDAGDITDARVVELWDDLRNKIQDLSTMVLNFWDFAGQELYLVSHQFFLGERALYLMLFDIRATISEGRLSFWMKSLHTRVPFADVLIVATHIDDPRCTPAFLTSQKKLVAELVAVLQKDHPLSIHGLFAINACTGDPSKELQRLKKAIVKVAREEIPFILQLRTSFLK